MGTILGCSSQEKGKPRICIAPEYDEKINDANVKPMEPNAEKATTVADNRVWGYSDAVLQAQRKCSNY
jgi:hypothetical protein